MVIIVIVGRGGEITPHQRRMKKGSCYNTVGGIRGQLLSTIRSYTSITIRIIVVFVVVGSCTRRKRNRSRNRRRGNGSGRGMRRKRYEKLHRNRINE